MNHHIEKISRLRSLSENYPDMRGGLIIPAGLILSVVGAKSLFSPYERTLVDNPSLFDTTNTFWAVTELTVIIISVLLLFGIKIWYKKQFGHRIPTEKQKTKELFFGILALISTLISIFIDYQLILPFSTMGLVFCGVWIGIIKKNPSMRPLYTLFFILQLTALASGPVFFADMQPDTLVYMRHMVGLNLLTAGVMLCISGYNIHKSLVYQIETSRLIESDQ